MTFTERFALTVLGLIAGHFLSAFLLYIMGASRGL
jgi:hypothetical protein